MGHRTLDQAGSATQWPYNGVLDEVRIYNRALSATEVQARYASAPEDNDTLHYYLGGKEVAFKKGDTLYYVHQDHLGSSAVITNSSGALVESMTYYPYGATRTGSIATTEEKFTGQRLDGTGLYYYNARYYDPGIGRFISPDRLIPEMSNPQAFNRYAYVYNNPLRYTDPNGECIGPLARHCRRAVQLTVDAGKAVVATAARVTKQEITRRGEAKVAEIQAEQAVSEKVGGAVADVGRATAEGLGSAIARQGELIAANQDPRVIIGGPAGLLKASAQLIEEVSPTGMIGPTGHESILGTAEVAAPLVAAARAIPEIMFVVTAVEIIYPPVAERAADALNQITPQLHEYYYDEFWD